MIGGLGNDVFWVDSIADAVIELANGGTDLVMAGLSFTLAANVENLILTGTAAINATGNSDGNELTGNSGANVLSGLDGNDTLFGGDGADTLDGGTGNDSMVGGNGDDVYFVDSVLDKTVETSLGGTDLVNASVSLTLAGYVENLTLMGNAAINGTGNTLNNVVTGNSAGNYLSGGTLGNDTLIGLGGDDTLDGGAGADDLRGGTGNDLYIVDNTLDKVTEAAGEGTDTVQSSINYTLGANVENLTLSGGVGTIGTGNELNNLITGNTGSNKLLGMAGNDTMIGGAGNDSLTGGTGADHFVFTTGTNGVDTITDFNAVEGGGYEGDVLEFRGLLHGTFAYLGAGAFVANGNTQAHVVGSQVQLDFDGNGFSDLSINLTGLTNASQLTALDFLFV